MIVKSELRIRGALYFHCLQRRFPLRPSSRPPCFRSTSSSWGQISAEYADLVVSIIAVWYLGNWNCLKCPHSSEQRVLLTIQRHRGCSPPTIMFRGGPVALGLAVWDMRGGHGGRGGNNLKLLYQAIWKEMMLGTYIRFGFVNWKKIKLYVHVEEDGGEEWALKKSKLTWRPKIKTAFTSPPSPWECSFSIEGL